MDLVANSFFIPNTQRSEWLSAFEYLRCGKTYYATVTLLPLLVSPVGFFFVDVLPNMNKEHAIRIVFAAVNDCPNRVINASL